VAIEFANDQNKETDTSVVNNHLLDSHIKIITDEPSSDAPDFKRYVLTLSKFIVDSSPRFTVGIYGGWGTGKTTFMRMLRNELDLNYDNTVETIWFDSWRYENEEYSAMVPLLRTIILGLENKLEIIRNSDQDKKRQILCKLKTTFTNVGNAIIRNTTAKIGLGAGDTFDVGATFDIGKMIEDYRADGSFIKGQERVYFHKHISERLKEELNRIRYDENGQLKYDFRLIIFVDDLDRCTPEKALELLESIKTFFDIEGIIYVIGMDPRTIDPIIKTKYGTEGKIEGMDYLQKIVQLPFQIPVWGAEDMSKTIRTMLYKIGMDENDIDEFMKTSIKLIITAAQLNPRDVKRFINTVIVSRYIYDQSIKDIEKLIAIQAFYFRGTKWINFLKSLTQYENRTKFLKHFILLDKRMGGISSITDLNKTINDIIDNKKEILLDKPILEIFTKLIELDDDDLFIFLKTSKEILLRIDKMEKYLRVAESIGIAERKVLLSDIDSEKQYSLIKDVDGVKKFNQYKNLEKPLIHLPYVDLTQGNLSKINLSGAFLFAAEFTRAKLTGADMSFADITGANLSKTGLTGAELLGADLSFTNLTGANLSKANLNSATLSQANLSKANLNSATLSQANLSKANLVEANLSSATLSEANLSGANLSTANLSGADLSVADLSGANLSMANLSMASLSMANLSRAFLPSANLSKANLSGANLSEAILSVANVSYADLTGVVLVQIEDFTNLKAIRTNFNNAIIDDADLIDYLMNKTKAENIPKKIHDKLELKSKLDEKRLSKEVVDYLLSITRLP